MIVRPFLVWTESAPANRRAQGAGALARAYLSGELPASEHADAAVAMTALLDDPSPLVRRALAEALGCSADAPHHVISALAGDQSDVASAVLSRSPILSDAELVDFAAVGDVFAQSAIAVRPQLSAAVAAALAEVGEREALIVLAVNTSADLPEFAMRRIVERHGEDGEVRQALLLRTDITPAVRHDLVVATARALSVFVTGREWISAERAGRISREACDKAIMLMSADQEHAASRELVRHLRASAALTAGLLLRSILSGNVVLFEVAVAELSRLKPVKVAGLVREFRGAGFAALYRKAGLPVGLLPVFRAALEAARACDTPPGCAEGSLSRDMVAMVLATCIRLRGAVPQPLVAALRRFEAEAARDEARQLAFTILHSAERPAADGEPVGEDFAGMRTTGLLGFAEEPVRRAA